MPDFLKFGVALVAAMVLQISCATPPPTPPPTPPGPVEGTYTTASFPVSGEAGFNRGTVYYPTNAPGRVGALVVAPGFTEPESAIAWLGPFMASRGFVTMTIETNSTGDFPAIRATQMVAARTYLSSQAGIPSSPLANVLDPARYAYSGHSMGGGGTLEAARLDPGASALFPLTPWNLSPTFNDVTIPTLVLACEGDAIAANAAHSEPMYASLAGPKAFAKATGGHFCAVTGAPETDLIGKYGADFLRAFLNGDANSRANLCAGPKADLLDYQTTIC